MPRCTLCFDGQQYQGSGGHLGCDVLIFEEDVMNVYKLYIYIHINMHIFTPICKT